MQKKKKIKYMILILIMFLFMILSPREVSAALLQLNQKGVTVDVDRYSTGSMFNMSATDNPVAYCIQQGQSLNDGDSFRVVTKIHINGKRSVWNDIYPKNKNLEKEENRTNNSSLNVRMGWILNQPDPNGSNHVGVPQYSEKQKAIYQFFRNMDEKRGKSKDKFYNYKWRKLYFRFI